MKTIQNFFAEAGLRQLTDDMPIVAEDGTDSFRDDWNKFRGTESHEFNEYVAVDNQLATSSVATVEELCADHMEVGEDKEEEEEDEAEPKPLPSFAKAHDAQVKVKSFVYVHSDNDSVNEQVAVLE